MAKAEKRLSGKKLDKAISDSYRVHGNFRTILLFDIPKVFAHAKQGYEAGRSIDECVKGFV